MNWFVFGVLVMACLSSAWRASIAGTLEVGFRLCGELLLLGLAAQHVWKVWL